MNLTPKRALLTQEMLCKEKATLIKTYVLTARKFAGAVSRLGEDSLSDENFEIVHRSVEEVLQDVAAARMKFQAHLQRHGC
jgi:hypothetical protein